MHMLLHVGRWPLVNVSTIHAIVRNCVAATSQMEVHSFVSKLQYMAMPQDRRYSCYKCKSMVQSNTRTTIICCRP